MEARVERRYPVAGSSALEADDNIHDGNLVVDGSVGLVVVGGDVVPEAKVVEQATDGPTIDEHAYPEGTGILLDEVVAKGSTEPTTLDEPEPRIEIKRYNFGQTKGKLVDERKLAVSSLVRNFRATEVHAVVLRAEIGKSNTRVVRNARIDSEGATLKGTAAKLTRMADSSLDEDMLYQQLSYTENLFYSRYFNKGRDANWRAIDAAADKYSGTDLMRNLDIFNSVMYDFHGPYYTEFCERLRRFGGYVIMREA